MSECLLSLFRRPGPHAPCSSLLFSGIPKYESLTGQVRSIQSGLDLILINSLDQARAMHKENRDLYNRTARMGQKSLYFGSSGTENETWV